jgi:hypothetical protein
LLVATTGTRGMSPQLYCSSKNAALTSANLI